MVGVPGSPAPFLIAASPREVPGTYGLPACQCVRCLWAGVCAKIWEAKGNGTGKQAGRKGEDPSRHNWGKKAHTSIEEKNGNERKRSRHVQALEKAHAGSPSSMHRRHESMHMHIWPFRGRQAGSKQQSRKEKVSHSWVGRQAGRQAASLSAS